jgi:two-component system, OmpR family, sensor kinase
LLDVGRLEQGILSTSPRPIDLVGLARDVALKLNARGGEIRVLGPGEVVVDADADRIRRAMESLLANAVQHSPEGSPVSVELGTERRAARTCAMVSISTQGAGLPPEILSDLFDRLASRPRPSGHGLALYLASRIIAAHGGTLIVDPAPGSGPSLTFSLPGQEPPRAVGESTSGSSTRG